MRFYFTSHPVHVGRHVAGVLRGPESEIGVLVVTVALVVFGRHRHRGYSSSRTWYNRLPTTALSLRSALVVVVLVLVVLVVVVECLTLRLAVTSSWLFVHCRVNLRLYVFSRSRLCRFCRVLRVSVRACPLNFSLFLYCPIFVLFYFSLPLSFSFSLSLSISLPFSRGFSPHGGWSFLSLYSSFFSLSLFLFPPNTTLATLLFTCTKRTRSLSPSLSFSFSLSHTHSCRAAFSRYSYSGTRYDANTVCNKSDDARYPDAGKCPEAAYTTVANYNGATLTCPLRRRLASSVAVTSARKASQARHFNSASSAAATRTTRQGCRSDSPSTNSAYHLGQVVHTRLPFSPFEKRAHSTCTTAPRSDTITPRVPRFSLALYLPPFGLAGERMRRKPARRLATKLPIAGGQKSYDGKSRGTSATTVSRLSADAVDD